jgi:NAD(P)-dependent dehydrogenase (short-subunit alcohol dehydrogenase family)
VPGLARRVAFVTGASSGIGAALAREFARLGADVALAARRTERLAALASDVTAMGRRSLAIPCDVTRDGDLEAAVARTREALGPVDVLVANAGFSVIGRLESLTIEDYRRQFETNVFGVLRTVYAGLADLRQTRGRLVLVGSVSAYLSFAGSSPYSMSKFALRALADSLRHELARDGVSVTLVNPGFVESEIYQVDNWGTRHPGAPSPVPSWLRMSAPRAARVIARAARRRRGEVGVTRLGKALIFLERHAPGVLSAAARLFPISARRGRGGTGR